ncbi:translocation/assembly module TamB domain-containing protein [Reinekea thalattae]|uniref:Translocation and assembly module TamB C-terminal domain-containing protein n=1 Tax=Reinekea thalattae TaxID=2593301 RepID=A0A5C8ZAH8_9GAMM|nr:translocation/assembly module TamB domain-containing protein [Reinekea thalattae]TXR54444.1 hypothetical protein FME95_07890 [Reinekea thalattae]
MALQLRAAAKRSWTIAIRSLLLLLLLSLLTLIYFVGTQTGRGLLAMNSARLVEWVSDYQLQIEGVQSPALSQWHIDAIRLNTSEGQPLAQAVNIDVQWNWKYALQNRWWFKSISIEQLDADLSLDRRSNAEKTDTASSALSQLYRRWLSIPALRVSALHVSQIALERAEMSDFHAQLHGQGEVNWGAIPAKFVVSLSETETGNYFAAELSADAIDYFRLKGRLDAEPLSAWSQWANWQLSEPLAASWDIRIDYSQYGLLDVLIDKWSVPWQSHELSAEGMVRYLVSEQQVEFLPLTLVLDGKEASAEGFIARDESDLLVSIDRWTLAPLADVFGVQDLSGELVVQSRIQGGWRRPLADSKIQASGQWQAQPFEVQIASNRDGANFNIEQASLTLANSQLNVAGSTNWQTDELSLAYQADINAAPLLPTLMPDYFAELQGNAQLTGEIIGTLDNPVVTIAGLAEGTWYAEDFRVQLSGLWQDQKLGFSNIALYSRLAQLTGDFSWQPANFRWRGQFDVDELRTDILPYVGIELPVDIDLSVHGDVLAEGEGRQFEFSGPLNALGRWQQWPVNASIQLDSLTPQGVRYSDSRVSFNQADVFAHGGVDWSAKQLDLHFEHSSMPVAAIAPWFSKWPEVLASFSGNARGSTSITGYWRRPAIATESEFSGSWLGQPLSLAISIDPTTAEDWQVDLSDMNWLGAQWRYHGAFEPYDLWLDGAAEVTSLSSSHLPLLSEAFTGIEKKLPERVLLDMNGQMSIEGKIYRPTLAGTLTSSGEIDAQPFSMTTTVTQLDTEHIEIAGSEAEWAQGAWSLSGFYNWAQQQVSMTASTDLPDASYLLNGIAPLLQQDDRFAWVEQWQGSLKGDLTLDNQSEAWLIEGDLSSEGVLQTEPYLFSWQGSGNLQSTLNHRLDLTWGTAIVRGRLQTESEQITGRVNVQRVDLNQLALVSSNIPDHLSGQLDASVSVAGTVTEPLFNADLKAFGQYQNHDFITEAQANGRWSAWQIERALFTVPDALEISLSGSGQATMGDLALNIVTDDLGYWLPTSGIINGPANVRLQANGDLKQPNLKGSVDWQASSSPLSLRADLNTLSQHYQLEASLISDEQTKVKLRLKTPVAELSRWQTNAADQPMEMRLAVNTSLDVLEPLLVNQLDQAFTGFIYGDISLDGRLSDPQWQGELHWRDGSYEHVGLGTRLSDMAVSLNTESKQWQLNGVASDAADGSVAVQGQVQFSASEGIILPHDISVATEIRNARLINQAQMEATMSGDIRAQGSYQNLTIVGDVAISRLNMQTDSLLWDGAPQLNIVEATSQGSAAADGPAFYAPQGVLDITLTAQQRVNLYGQGITAELSGQFSITDNLYSPVLAGQFSLVRGTYLGFGKVFTLESGTVQIQGDQVALDIQGNYSNNDLDVTLEISGNQNELSLSLTSDAAEGQDELLALLLFGENIEQMSIVQAVQLANAVNNLRTGETGLDIVGEARNELSLDTLVIDTDSNDDGELTFSVSAGKYINDYLYLEVEQDGSDEEFRSSLQYKLTKRAYIELYTQGEVGELDTNGIELNWSLDY